MRESLTFGVFWYNPRMNMNPEATALPESTVTTCDKAAFLNTLHDFIPQNTDLIGHVIRPFIWNNKQPTPDEIHQIEELYAKYYFEHNVRMVNQKGFEINPGQKV